MLYMAIVDSNDDPEIEELQEGPQNLPDVLNVLGEYYSSSDQELEPQQLAAPQEVVSGIPAPQAAVPQETVSSPVTSRPLARPNSRGDRGRLSISSATGQPS